MESVSQATRRSEAAGVCATVLTHIDVVVLGGRSSGRQSVRFRSVKNAGRVRGDAVMRLASPV
jgi:hypothetical protein